MVLTSLQQTIDRFNRLLMFQDFSNLDLLMTLNQNDSMLMLTKFVFSSNTKIAVF